MRRLLARLFGAKRGISPRMVALILEYERAAAVEDAIDYTANPAAWDAASTIRCAALDALLAEQPASIAEFHAKFTALIPATADDSDFVILHALADDARALVE